MPEFTGSADGRGRRVAVVVARFNDYVTRRLLDGALEALLKHGAAMEDVDVYWVPGAWELPFAARRAAGTGRYDAVVALGAVIRGETPHFDYVAGESARALAQASADFDIPITFGVLTTDTTEQADARAGGPHGNKGWDATLAALELVDLFSRLDAADEA